MTRLIYEYRTERFTNPPTAEQLGRLARESWRLVSVTVDSEAQDSGSHDEVNGQPRFVAYLERPATSAAIAAAAAGSRLRSEPEERRKALSIV